MSQTFEADRALPDDLAARCNEHPEMAKRLYNEIQDTTNLLAKKISKLNDLKRLQCDSYGCSGNRKAVDDIKYAFELITTVAEWFSESKLEKLADVLKPTAIGQEWLVELSEDEKRAYPKKMQDEEFARRVSQVKKHAAEKQHLNNEIGTLGNETQALWKRLARLERQLSAFCERAPLSQPKSGPRIQNPCP
jgi:uncharacterized coiled-coil DUF342 family protein